VAKLSTKPNRFYPSIPGIGDTPDTHANALRQIRESIETHERRNSNYLKSFIRFEELITLGIIDDSGNFVLDLTAQGTNTALNDISDVDVGGAADNQMLGFDFASGLWTNQTAAELGLAEVGHTHPGLGDISLDDLTDVDTTGSLPWDLLYRNASGWIPTSGSLQFDGSSLYLGSSNLNFYSYGGVGMEILANQPASDDMTIVANSVHLSAELYVDYRDAYFNSGNWIRWQQGANYLPYLGLFPTPVTGAVGSVLATIFTNPGDDYQVSTDGGITWTGSTQTELLRIREHKTDGFGTIPAQVIMGTIAMMVL
jgi:hypothetical protein